MDTNRSFANLRRFSICFALAAAALLLPRQASGFACLWDGSSSTNWATAANWSTCNSTTPQSGDTVTINSGGNQPSLSTAATVAQVTLGAGATLTVASGGALTLSNGLTGGGNLTVASGGTLNWNAGVIDGAGTFTIQAGGNLNLASSQVTLQRALNNAGTTTTSGGGYFYILSGGGLTNTGTVDMQNSSYAFYGGAAGVAVTNTGTFKRTTSSGTATVYAIAFTNTSPGTVSIQSGTLDLNTNASSTSTGSYSVSSGAILTLTGSSTATISGAISGAGTIVFGGSGAFNLTGAHTITNTTIASATVNFNQASAVTFTNLTTNSGTLAGSANVSVSNIFDMNSCTFAGGGTFTLAAGATGTFDSSNLTLTRPFVNAGTIMLSSGAYFYLTGGSLTNQSTGTIDIQHNTYAVYGSGQTFTNSGTIMRSTSSGTANIYNLAFANTSPGTVAVQSGTLDIVSTGNTTSTGAYSVSAGAILSFTGSGNNAVSGAIAGAGSVTFGGSGTNNLTGTYSIGNTTIAGGTVNFNQGSAQSLANLTMNSGTLAGSAAVSVTNTFDMNSGTMSGSATFTLANGATGTFDSSTLTLTRPFVNAGTITLSSSAYFNLTGGSFTNQSTGTIDIQHNTYAFYGSGQTFTNSGSITRSTSSGIAYIANLAFANTSTGTVAVQSGTLDINSTGSTTSPGAFSVSAGATLSFTGSGTNAISGAISGAGTVTFGGSGINNLTGTYSIGNTTLTSGTVNFNQGSAQSLANLTMNSGTLAGSAAVRVTDTFDMNSGTMSGNATFTLAAGATGIFDSSYLNVTRPFVNAGTITLSSNAYIYVTGGSFTNQATGTVDIQHNTYAFYGSSSQNLSNAGTITRSTSSGTASILYLNFTNTGTIDIQTGTFSVQTSSSTFTQTAGATHLNGGNLEIGGSPGTFNIQGGVLDGNGTINGNISVSGTGQFNPGTSPGEISITTNHTYTQAAPGVFNVDVNGTSPGFDYDRILVSGAATLGGELKVNLGYTPALGDSFTILEHASRTGTFTKLTFPSAGAGRGWDLSYSATQTKLTIAELAGALLFVDKHAGTGTLSDGNGVLEAGERVVVEPNWFNMTDSPIASAGTASNIAGPAGATYTLNDTTAGYGTTNPNSTTNCFDATTDCFQASVSSPVSRPAVHWDANFKETLTGGSNRTWQLHVGDSFTDVPRSQPFYAKIETLLHTGITAGCTVTTYCPTATVSRGAMAIFIAKGLAGGGPNVPAAGSVGGSPYNCVPGPSGVSLFTDVKPTDIFCRHVHYIAGQNVTAGCSATEYCPSGTITRIEMAAFIAKAVVAPLGGTAVPLSYTDPVSGLSYNCNGANIHFTDVPYSNVFCKHVHFLWSKGIIGGISPTLYGPTQNVTRDAMAKFLSNAFNLLLYGPVP